MAAKVPRVAIIILNWNGWRDTVECLESVFLLDYPDFRVIVCDNGSTDGSLEHIKRWMEGRRGSLRSVEARSAPTAQAAPFTEYGKEEAEAGGVPDVAAQLVLIRNAANLGFAGGNNVGLRYALLRGYDYAWILNNDTVVNPRALVELVERMKMDHRIGICGSTLAYYDQPETVQALAGAAFDYERGIGVHIGFGEPLRPLRNRTEVEAKLDYIMGASMLVSREFLQSVGLMSESYFLYYEEIDWTLRAKGKFSLAWAPNSLVLHKEGATIGTSYRTRPSDLALQYLYRSRLRFANRYLADHFWKIWRSVAYEMLVYLKRADWPASKIIATALLTETFGKTHPEIEYRHN